MKIWLIKTYKQVQNAVCHLLLRLWQSPLLLGWLIIGTVIAFIVNGFYGIISSFINLILIGIYAVIIKLMTEKKEPPKPQLKIPRIELLVGILFTILSIFMSFLFFHLVRVPIISNIFNNFLNWLYTSVDSLTGIGFSKWSLNSISNALYCIIIELIPVVIIYIAFRYKLRGMSLKPRFWALTFTLLGMSVILGLPFSLLKAPIYQTLAIYFIHIFINGLPEEFFFRGFLLPRFESVLGNPINALVLTSILFNAVHIPASIANGSSIPMTILDVFSMSYPSGLIWGYLYLRTRSIIPGMLWHTANMRLGFFLIS